MSARLQDGDGSSPGGLDGFLSSYIAIHLRKALGLRNYHRGGKNTVDTATPDMVWLLKKDDGIIDLFSVLLFLEN